MSCGFGAVVLVFLIINHETNEQREFASDDVLSNNRQLDYQIQIENKELRVNFSDGESIMRPSTTRSPKPYPYLLLTCHIKTF